ncbi:arginine--tRNA ligase [Candidatus Peregrinibacteria bacterium]|nr:arginine--tRNA ligase [Candidatus Peregrinibacteria bacterium]
MLKKAFGGGDVKVLWTSPKEIAHGDATTTVALELSKKLGTKPRAIAEVLAKELSHHSSIEKVEIAGAGYVNVWLKPSALITELHRSRAACTARVPKKTARPVIVEYSQPNIAKPLGVHHLLSTVIGQAIANLHEHAGQNVIRWNYLGDWGTQFGKLAVALEKWGKGKKPRDFAIDELLALYVKFHDEAEKDPTLEDQARKTFRALEQGDPHLRNFREDIVAVTKGSLGALYGRLHVNFDLDLGESFYEDKMDAILEEGKRKEVFETGEGGALIVRFPEETGMPPYMVQKSDGATLYSTRDLAQMRYRIDTYNPEGIYIVTDIAQKLHFEQLMETCRMLGWKLPDFENVLVGRMRFADKKMSTRKGNILKLEEVLDEAVRRADTIIADRGDSIQTDDPKELSEMMGIGAVVYGILSQNRKMDLVFDWDKMLSFEGNSAPYLQYTHARAKSVLRKSDQQDFSFPKEIKALTEKERVVIGTLLQFQSVLDDALETHMPHKLANFLYQLSQDYNAFYNGEPILQADQAEERALRLALTSLTATVLKTGAELLTLRVPERM